MTLRFLQPGQREKCHFCDDEAIYVVQEVEHELHHEEHVRVATCEKCAHKCGYNLYEVET